jgi:uncharacterized protein (DUF305 family)
MSGMDVSGSMPGMMSKEGHGQPDEHLGAAFDQMSLTMMIEHHQGAIDMVKTEQRNGMYIEAVARAKQIETAQTDDIATMHGLLG